MIVIYWPYNLLFGDRLMPLWQGILTTIFGPVVTMFTRYGVFFLPGKKKPGMSWWSYIKHAAWKMGHIFPFTYLVILCVFIRDLALYQWKYIGKWSTKQGSRGNEIWVKEYRPGLTVEELTAQANSS